MSLSVVLEHLLTHAYAGFAGFVLTLIGGNHDMHVPNDSPLSWFRQRSSVRSASRVPSSGGMGPAFGRAVREQQRYNKINSPF